MKETFIAKKAEFHLCQKRKEKKEDKLEYNQPLPFGL
jgi:hypothetical protein